MKRLLLVFFILINMCLPGIVCAATEVDLIDADMAVISGGLQDVVDEVAALNTTVATLTADVASLESNVQILVDNQDQLQWLAYIVTGLCVAGAFIAGIRVVNS